MIMVWVGVRIWDRVRVTVRVIVTVRVRFTKSWGQGFGITLCNVRKCLLLAQV